VLGENWRLRKLTVQQLDYDLTPVGGLALVGHSVTSVADTRRACVRYAELVLESLA
jgi:hypothetical protein